MLFVWGLQPQTFLTSWPYVFLLDFHNSPLVYCNTVTTCLQSTRLLFTLGKMFPKNRRCRNYFTYIKKSIRSTRFRYRRHWSSKKRPEPASSLNRNKTKHKPEMKHSRNSRLVSKSRNLNFSNISNLLRSRRPIKFNCLMIALK